MIYQKSPNFVPRKIAGELILIPLQRQIDKIKSIYSLNQTACALWEKLDGASDLNKIKSQILAEYEVSEADLDRDLTQLIEQLTEIQAIQPVS